MRSELKLAAPSRKRKRRPVWEDTERRWDSRFWEEEGKRPYGVSLAATLAAACDERDITARNSEIVQLAGAQAI